ncbi:hypothetical protein DPMN_020163 [Dreissena polymorpha]|uniref:Uncharacterized protein n=1 Tax=Dreissena polymorpha TaxID=45954 RepID=A0A9D4RUS3_DREPO|nr:hypothetical protein DPMN_002516 [Dreissena polymorpha]KAH3879377.1 hypothetical protein DPMN_003279 [Dreissena polymorpha]KAH3895993.1 hypothetical protein DPMN_020163 [Dreissena polymorpha]
MSSYSVIGLHATEAVAVIDIKFILPDKTWLVIIDLTTIPAAVTSTSTSWSRSHFHLNKLEVSTGPVADLSSIPAAH